ncbi:MAG: phosphoglucosamine mutase, partial [bacterium]
MSNLMVSVSGVRGVIGQGLTPDVMLNFASAFGTYVQSGKIVVGRDSRVSGDMLKNAVVSGLMAVGCDIIDIGVCPTPTTQLATERLKA